MTANRSRTGPLAGLVLCLSIGAFPLDSADASPFSPGTLDAEIEQCMQEVDADSLQSYVQALQDFFTRHTNSDTTSATVGIGAARRWVFAKFEEFAAQGGNITPSYHTFTTVIDGVGREHRNVIGEIPGTAPAEERRVYVLGGHLDSRNEVAGDATGSAFGADDDASGVACALELGRVMSQKSWPMTFRFVAFVGEEQGLVGSSFLANDYELTGEPIAAMLNNDMMASITGAPDPDSTAMTDTTLARVYAGGTEDGPHRQFQRYLKAMGNAYVPVQDIILFPAEDRPSRGGDHQSFADEGFTAIRFMEYLEEVDRQHTTLGDTLGPHLDMNYHRRNTQIDLATLGNLALSPASPGGLAVGDIGDSTGFRLQWPTTNTEPDLAGYLVTMRTPGSLDYETVLDVGLVNEHVVAAPGADSVYFGLSIQSTGGHRALISREVLGVLSSVPIAPLGLAASPDESSIQLAWQENAEGDLAGYHVYRSNTSGSGYAQLTATPISTASYDDNTAIAGTYHYYVVTAVDSSSNESVFSVEAAGRLVTLDSGILLVDETKNGANAWFPSDAVADSVYGAMMDSLPHVTWDVDTLGIPTISDLGAYSSVMWIADDFNTVLQGFTAVTQHLGDATGVLADYLDFGGNVLLTSWEGAKGLNLPFDYPFDPEPGDFLYDYFGIDAIDSKRQKAFKGGIGQSFFSNAALEPGRLNPNWNGKLIRAEYMTALAPGTEAAYLFDSDDPDSLYHQQVCGSYRDGAGYRTVCLGFPLYHLGTADARDLIQAAMSYFGELPSTGAGSLGSGPIALALAQNRPNPFGRETEIVFSVPEESAEVKLTVYDLAGRRVRTVVAGRLPPGVHSEVWDGLNEAGRRVSSGVYFYRLETEDRRLTRKLIVLR